VAYFFWATLYAELTQPNRLQVFTLC